LQPKAKPKPRKPRAKAVVLDPYKVPLQLPYGTTQAGWAVNDSLAQDPPLSIDYRTLNAEAIPDNWSTKARAEAACKGKEFHARLAGYVSFEVTDLDIEDVKNLIKERRYESTDLGFNENGEFSTAFGKSYGAKVSKIFQISW